MLFSGRLRVDAQAAACGWLSAAPSLRFFYRLFLLLGATFVAVLLATGPADAEEGSGPGGEVSVSSGIESQLVTETVEQATETVTETAEPVAERVEPVTEPVVEVVEPVIEPVTEPVVEVVEPVIEPVIEPVVEVVEPVIEPVVEPVTEPVVEVVEPVIEPVTEPVTEPVVEVVEPVTEPVIEPVVEPVIEPVVVPSAAPGRPVAVATVALQVASPAVCGSVAGAESVTSWAAAAADADAGAGRGDMIKGPRAVPQGPAQAPTAPSAPSAPSAPGQGPASVSGSGGLAPSLGVLDNSDVGATLSADRFAAGDDTVPHSRAALLRNWPG